MGLAKRTQEQMDDLLFRPSGDVACLEHLHDGFLGRRVEEVDPVAEQDCVACGSAPARPFLVDSLTERVVSVLRRYRERAAGELYRDPESDNGWAIAGTQSSSEVVRELLDGACDDDLANVVATSVVDDEWFDPRQLWLQESELITFSWSQFRDWIAGLRPGHVPTAVQRPPGGHWSEPADGIHPSEMLPRLADLVERLGLVRDLEEDQVWVRAVNVPSGEPRTARRLGSAPADRAEDNRMTQAGDSAFYGAEDIGTALAEIGPARIGEDSVIGHWRTSAATRVVDLCLVPEPPSLFDIERAHEREGLRALQDFADDLSKPLVPGGGGHSSYRATQALTSHLRQHFTGLDGVMYRSSRTGRRCITLFVGNDACVDHRSDPATTSIALGLGLVGHTTARMDEPTRE